MRDYDVIVPNFCSGLGYGLTFREIATYGGSGGSHTLDAIASGRHPPEVRRPRSRILRWIAAGCVALGIALSPATRAADTDVIALRNVTVVDLESGQLLAGRTVVWARSRVVAVGKSEQVTPPAGAKQIDGKGRYLIPGLWDMHVHVHAKGDAALHTEKTVLPLFIAHGVTAVRDMSDEGGEDYRESAVPAKHRWDFEARAGLRIGPRIVAAATFAVDGPHGAEPSFLNAATPEEARKLVRFFKDEGAADFIKVYSGIPRDAYFAFMHEARRSGISVAGHKPLTVSFIEAADAGQRSIEHAREILLDSFPGAEALQRSSSQRNLPPARLSEILAAHDPKMLQAIFDAMIRNDTYYTPTHLTRLFDWKAAANDRAYLDDPRLKLLTDAAQTATAEDVARTQQRASNAGDANIYRAYFEKGLQVTGLAQQAGVNILAGTDAGDSYCFPGSGLHDELSWLVKAGLTPLQALRAATVNPARYMGRVHDFVSIGAGKLADLVLLDRNPLEDIANVRTTHAVVMNGRMFERASIDRMKKDALAFAASRASGL
jgi:imidazolonepropionase-like amidohydrolase